MGSFWATGKTLLNFRASLETLKIGFKSFARPRTRTFASLSENEVQEAVPRSPSTSGEPATPGGGSPRAMRRPSGGLGLVQAMGRARFRAREGSPRWWRPLTPIL